MKRTDRRRRQLALQLCADPATDEASALANHYLALGITIPPALLAAITSCPGPVPAGSGDRG